MELSAWETLWEHPRGSANPQDHRSVTRKNRRIGDCLAGGSPGSGDRERDRGGVYVDGVTQGAPLATQVCDRWHLLKNLGEAVEAFLIRAHIRLPETAVQEPTQERPFTTYSATPAQQGKTQARLLRKWKLYQRIHELHAGGMSLRKIGEELGVARGTVRKYFRQPPEPPLPTPRPLRASKLDPYEDYILTRLAKGAAMLLRSIVKSQRWAFQEAIPM